MQQPASPTPGATEVDAEDGPGSAMASAPREVLTYETFGVAARELATQVVDSGFEPDWIVCIARGGLLIGGAIGYALPLKNIATLNVEFYTDVDERLEVPVVLPPVLDLIDLENTKVLLVDDVADTGETLAMVIELLTPSVAELRSLVLYEKSRSVVHPDYVWKHTDRWINFPWSTLAPIGAPATRRSSVTGTTAARR